MNQRFYVMASDSPPAFDSIEAAAAHITKTKGDVSAFTVIKGIALKPKMQMTFDAVGAPTRSPRVTKEPPLPGEATIARVTALYADGKGRSKIKAREALSDLGVDVVDGCIDWMAHTGRLTCAGKTYTATTPAKETP